MGREESFLQESTKSECAFARVAQPFSSNNGIALLEMRGWRQPHWATRSSSALKRERGLLV